MNPSAAIASDVATLVRQEHALFGEPLSSRRIREVLGLNARRWAEVRALLPAEGLVGVGSQWAPGRVR